MLKFTKNMYNEYIYYYIDNENHCQYIFNRNVINFQKRLNKFNNVEALEMRIVYN